MGNIMDNVKGLERKVVFYFDLAMSFSFLIWALSFMLWKDAFINYRLSHPDEIPPTDALELEQEIMHLTSYLNYIIAGCEVIILNVQIINWFSKSRIAYVLAVFSWS